MLRNALTVLVVMLIAGAGLLPFSTEPRANDAAAAVADRETSAPGLATDVDANPPADERR